MAVFDGVHYTLSPSLPPTRRHDLSSLLDLNGATSDPPHTHLIALAGSHSHQDSQESSSVHGEHANTNGQGQRRLKVVSDRWVDRSVVMGKLQPEQYYSPDPAMIFSGVVACATDISASDLEVLSAGVTALGGQWRIGLTRDVTHLFALHPGSDKYNTALHFAPHTHMTIVTPHWFDDSVRLGRRLPETPYTWPDPLVLRAGTTLTVDDDVNLNVDGKRKRKRAGEGDGDGEEGGEGGASFSIGSGGEMEKVWGGRRILLSRSLELGDGSREAVEAGIKRAGGVVVRVPAEHVGREEEEGAEERVVDKCDVLVTRWRSGRAYLKAVRASLLIGTLTWLFSVESSGTLHSPLDSLLWYPVPRGGVAGLVGCEISLTNYTGAARDYLKRLIFLIGAKFTPSMSASNKVLVAGFQPSPKTTRALSWSIPIVNHTWLEDCFVEWRSLTVGLERYIVFPPGIDFGKMLMTSSGGATSNVPILSGGAVPGGRGVGVIDIELEEARDAAFSRDIGTGENGTGTHAALAQGQGESKPNKDKTLAKNETMSTKQNGDIVSNGQHPTRRSRSRTPRAPSVSSVPKKARSSSGLGAFADEVIEIPDDDDDGDDGGEVKRSRGRLRKLSSAKSASPVRRTGGSPVKGESRSGPSPSPSRTVPPGTSNSAKEVEEAIVLDVEEEQEGEFIAGDDVVRMGVDDDEDGDAPAKSKSHQKGKSNVKGKGVARQLPPSSDDGNISGDDDDDTRRVREDANASSRLAKGKSTARPKPKPKSGPGLSKTKDLSSTKATKANKPETRESSPSPPPAITYPSPYRPKPRLVRRSLASSSARKSPDVESELQEEDEDEGEEEPVKQSTRVSATRKSKPTAERKLVRAESDSDLSSPPRRIGVVVSPVKSSLKPKPKPTQVEGEESEEEVYVRPVKTKQSTKGKAKEDSEDEANVRPAKAKGSRKGKEKEGSEDEVEIRPVKAKGSKKGEEKERGDNEVDIRPPKAKGSKKDKEKEDSDDEDEAYIRPVKVKESKRGKEETREKSKDQPTAIKGMPVPKPKAKEKEKAKKKAAPSPSPTRSPSPLTPPTASFQTPKRTVSVLVPSLPKDYFTPGGTKVKRKEQGSPEEEKEKEKPAEPATRAGVTERPTSAFVGKKGKPAFAKPKPSPAIASGKLKASSSLKPSKPRPEGSEAEVEETTSMAVDSPVAATSSARGGVRRSAANKATTKLREEIMPDVVHYENERKKEKRRRSVGGESIVSMHDEDVATGRDKKRRRVEEESAKGKGKKTQRREEEDEVEEVEMQIIPTDGRAGKSSKGKTKAVAILSNGSEDEETGQRPTKGTTAGDKKAGPQKRISGPLKNMWLMTTGVTLSDEAIKGLTKLGIKMTTQPTGCTHLIAKGVVRTEKFLCAMSVSPYVLREDWAHESISKGKILPEDDFLLSDPAAEKKWKFKFSEALERSKGSQAGSQLLKHMTFYVTPKVSLDSKLLKNIVASAGGQVQMTNPTARILKGRDNRHVISCQEDISIWRPLVQEGYRIYSTELILQAVLKQKIEWENEECIVA
ncbi:hypothetical protein F5I97DRAFT_1905100 [Phlebopus sp. FC_14]|nr:hypothetical protein F5I97DRAFT_1905100 [Phlebopus sp. FC_14]